MKLSAILAPLIAAKVPHEVIMQTVQAWESEQSDALEKRRASDRERQAKKRSNHVTSRDVTVTASSRTGVEDNLKTNISSGANSSMASPAAQPEKTKRGSRLPDDFIPDISEAGHLGLPEPDAKRESDKFRDYWRGQPGQRGVKLDWPATWRNWCRSAVERKQPRRNDPPPKPRNIGDAIRDEARRLGVLSDEPVSENRGFHSEGNAGRNVTVLDLAFKPALKGFG